MNRSHWINMVPSARPVRVALVIGALCAIAPAQILENHSGSLTTYLAGKSGVQDAKPRPEQRATNLDGSVRRGSTFAIAIAGNPYENAWRGETEIDGVRLDTGTWSPTAVDLSLPAQVGWPIGRSYNARQTHSGSQYDSGGPQGVNWVATSMPEIVLYEDGGDHANDVIYVVLGSDRFLEYGRVDATSAEYKGKNGAAGRILYTAGTPDTYKLLDQNGNDIYFFGFDTSTSGAYGQLWKIVDPDGAVAFVGDATTASTAVTNGYSSGRLTYAFDSADRRFTYSYNGDTPPHISQVKAETKTGGTWFSSPTGVTEVGKVDYTYYGDESNGDPGDLKTATVTLPLTDSGVSSVAVTYYRYWEGAFNATTNPGYPHHVKLVLSAEGARRYDWAGDSTFDNDFLTETTTNLKPYAAAYFEYDSNHKVNLGWFNGQCGCGGAGSGEFTLRYETNASYSDGTGYDEEWARRTVVGRPDGSYLTQYFDEAGQALHRVITDADPATEDPEPKKWVEWVERNSNGCVTEQSTPANVTAYHHDGDPDYFSRSTSAGLIWKHSRTGSGVLTGFESATKYMVGTSGSIYFVRSFTYDSPTEEITSGGGTVTRPIVSRASQFQVASTVQEYGEERYSDVGNTVSSGLIALTEQTGTELAVASANLGANATNTSRQHYTLGGLPDYAKDALGRITYREYTNGQLTKVIEDADTDVLSPPTGGNYDDDDGTPPPLIRTTNYAYDAQGRRASTTLPDGRVTTNYYTVLADRRLVTLQFPKYDSGASKRYGPVSYSVTNLAGKAEARGVIALTSNESTAALTAYIDETDSDPITAVDTGTVAQLRTSILDSSGTQVSEERTYFLIPASGAGTDGTNYDPTTLGYDDLGRRWRVKEAHGTITRTVYDARGLPVSRWIGTNDSTFDGGESGTDNMVKVEETIYDDADDDGDADDGGNGYAFRRIEYIQDSGTGKRETQYKLDARGRAIAIVNPTSPHTVSAFDNMGRVTATAQYSSSSGLSSTSAPTTTTNRVALSETFYDERGQVWKTLRHKLNSDGTEPDPVDTLDTFTWRDAEGRVVKRDGEQLEKFAYDRLGRQTHHFVLVKVDVDEDTWAEAQDVASDIVLEERQTAYDAYGKDVMEATVSRYYNDEVTSPTTGALDSNADGDALAITAANVAKGRVQITAKWYDAFDRLQDVVQYGTNDASENVATFDRDGLAVPSRSDTALRTTYEYNTDGTLKQVTDPKALVTRYEYDAEGRRTKVIGNYVDGTPGGGTNGDEDQVIAYAFTDGLQTSITADLPSGETDQVTTYTFGTVKGTSAGESKVATGHLLRKVQYPDSSDATNDIVAFAYNAQGQEIWKRDQATSGNNSDYNITETDFDDAGRQTARRVTQKRSACNGAVLRIATAYDALGRTDTVTQYDAATSGNVVDEVKNVYDAWGNLTNFRQDHDSAVGGSGYREVAYTYAKATSGRNTLRRTTETLPDGSVYTLNYRSGNFDDYASRVSAIQDAYETDIAVYQYNGVGQVVKTDYSEVAAFSKLYTGTGVSFAGLDQFDRMKISKWTKDLATNRDFYKVTWSYDRNSNITLANDGIFDGHDAAYTNDNLNRLIDAEEGTWDGSAITSQTRDELWTLNQTGNPTRTKRDLNGDADYVDTDEWDDTRAHNAVNELNTRDTDTNSSVNFTFAYDAAGNMTDDGETYKFEWDAFGRLTKVTTRADATVGLYTYNGLGFLISVQQDTDSDSDVDGNDLVYHRYYDERWRMVGEQRGTDTYLKAVWLYHCAGMGGRGGSSYIDSVVLRDRDMSNGWTGVGDGTLEERVYICQDPRHADVVRLLDSSGALLEGVWYSAYGVPFAFPNGDTDGDGDCDGTDDAQVTTWVSGSYDVRGDLDLDGDVDAADETAVAAGHTTLGRGLLSASGVGNRKGYVGYEFESATAKYLVRRRWLDTTLGRWLHRDPLGYVDGMSRYQYVQDVPVTKFDPYGLAGFGSSFLTSWEEAAYPCNGTCDDPEPAPPPAPPSVEPEVTLGPLNPVPPPQTGSDCRWVQCLQFSGSLGVIEFGGWVCGDDPNPCDRTGVGFTWWPFGK